eukprot:Gb_05671 [translate_table: standard]
MSASKIKVGDAISIYWDGDKKWYAGQVLKADEQGNCHVLYNDGEQEHLNLGDVKYRAGRNWKGCLREKKSKDGKDPLLKVIGDTLFDIEDRLPPKGVLKNQSQWWEKWHDTVSQAVESGSIQDILKPTLEIALQMKKSITTAWWHSNNVEWKKQVKKASTVFDIDLLVKELQIKVVDWSAARRLFGDSNSHHAPEQKVDVAQIISISVEGNGPENAQKLDTIAHVDIKSSTDTDAKQMLQQRRHTQMQTIQSVNNSTDNGVIVKLHNDNMVQQSQLPESKHVNVHTRQSKKRARKDCSDKSQNKRHLVKTDLEFHGDTKISSFQSDVNGKRESNLTTSDNFMKKMEHARWDEKEVSLAVRERVDESKKIAHHGKQDKEQLDISIQEKDYPPMETEQDVKKDEEQLCIPVESEHEKKTSPQQNDRNVTTEEQLKKEQQKVDIHLHDLKQQGQKMEVMAEWYTENEDGSRQKRLKVEMDALPALRRSRRIDVKSTSKQKSLLRNLDENCNYLVECNKVCDGTGDSCENINGKSLKRDLPHIKANNKLKESEKCSSSRHLASSNNEKVEGKGNSDYAVGVKSDGLEKGASFGSQECLRDDVQIGKMKGLRSKRTCLRKNVGDASTVGKREHWRIQWSDDSMTLRMTRSKQTCTASIVENGKEKSEEREVRSMDEDKATIQQGCHAGKVSGSNSCVCSTEVEGNHISLNQLCSICQYGGADNFLLLCDGKGCSYSFHTFCLRPPLLTVPEGDWLCPHCKELSSLNYKQLKRGGTTHLPKKIEKILGRRQVQVGPEINEVQLQYLVKWSSLSHHHDTWVPEDWVLHHDRARLFNFQRKFPFSGNTIPDLDGRKPEWLKIDRVIACREKMNNDDDSYDIKEASQSGSEKNGKYEFLVKWMGLDYCDATWEDSCSEELLATADKLVERHQKANEWFESDSGHPVAVGIKEQPSYLRGGVLHGYQLQGMKWLLHNFERRSNVILADEMGLGKTIQAIGFIVCMKYEKLGSKPVLVIAPKSTLPGWDQEFRQWAPDLNVIIYQGDKESRICIREHEFYSPKKRVLFDVLVTSFELAMVDNFVLQKFKWSSIVVDEGHRIKNFRSKLGTLLKQQATDFRLLLTGTPLQNTLAELFALLHFLDPSEFPDPESGACAFSEIGMSSDKNDSAKAHEKMSHIHELLKPRMLRRLKAEVLRNLLPGKRLVEVPCALTTPQRQLYVNLLKRNYKELNKGIRNGQKRSLNSLLVDLKMCCNHPYLFPGREPANTYGEKAFKLLVGASGKLQLLEKLLPRLKQGGHRVLLFSQMTRMLDILEDFLYFLGFTYCRIDGSTPSSERQQRIKNFSSPDSTIFVFLISTRAGGLGINLPSADTVIIYDPDFNPFVDLQAQSRAHRIGQVNSVIVYQLITKCSVEEKILQRSRRKLAMENLVMNPVGNETFQELHTILLHGARNILDEQDIEATSILHTDEDIEILLNRDIMTGEKDTSEENGYLGAIQGLSMLQDEEEKPAVDGKVWEELLGPLTEPADVEEELGRGKRQRKEVRYNCEPMSDDDEEYSPSRDESSSMSDYSSNKSPDREVTSAPEVLLEQHERLLETGYSSERQSVHQHHSSATSMAIGSTNSMASHMLSPMHGSISFANSSFQQTLFSSTSTSGYSNLEGQGTHVENIPSTNISKHIVPALRGQDAKSVQSLQQQTQVESSITGHSLNHQCSVSDSPCTSRKDTLLRGSTLLDAGIPGQFPGTSTFEHVQTQLLKPQMHGYPSLYVNHSKSKRSKLPVPAVMPQSQSSVYDLGQVSGEVKAPDPAHNKCKVSRKPELSPKDVPNAFLIPEESAGQEPHLTQQIIGKQGIDPLISEINKMADAILERVSLMTPKRIGSVKSLKHAVSADGMSGRSPLIKNTGSFSTVNHLDENSLLVPKVNRGKQIDHMMPSVKSDNNLS